MKETLIKNLYKNFHKLLTHTKVYKHCLPKLQFWDCIGPFCLRESRQLILRIIIITIYTQLAKNALNSGAV